MSPIQLTVSGLTASNYQMNTAGTFASHSHPQLNLDTENLEFVEVPCNEFKPRDQISVESLVTPAAQATVDRKTMYRDVICTVGQHLQGTCSRCVLN